MAQPVRADPHPQQAARLAALRRYDILDTPREAEYDEVVALVARLCEAPIAVVNLIDEDRQWFKAEVGLGVRETPLETSLCSHVILERDYVEIPDTLADPRMRDNPLCLDPGNGLRFYAGALLQTGDGFPIGTLCVLDTRPRTLTPLQRQAVQVLGRQVMRQIELRETLKREALLRKEIDHRVKNSLQSVGAFVRLQHAQATGEGAAALQQVAQQIDTVALLHDELCREGGEAAVDLSAYLGRVATLLRDAAPVPVLWSFDDAFIAPTRATTVATIVNELVANAIKHGAREGVRLHGHRLDEQRYRIVCDNDAAATRDGLSNGIGLRIVKAGLRQLGGELDAGPDGDGYRATITFLL